MAEARDSTCAQRHVSGHLQLFGPCLLELLISEPGLFREVVLEPRGCHLIGVSTARKQDGGKDWALILVALGHSSPQRFVTCVGRCCLLAALICCLECSFAMENPAGSMLALHPRLIQTCKLLQRAGVKASCPVGPKTVSSQGWLCFLSKHSRFTRLSLIWAPLGPEHGSQQCSLRTTAVFVLSMVSPVDARDRRDLCANSTWIPAVAVRSVEPSG